MRPLSLDDRVTIDSEVLFREIGDEGVLLDLTRGTYYGLNGVGTRIWTLLAETPRLADVHRRILAEYDVDASVLQRDLLRLADALCASGLGRLEP
jgi:hypothetical protein